MREVHTQERRRAPLPHRLAEYARRAYGFVESYREALPALFLKLPSKTFFKLAAEPLRIPSKELVQKGSALRPNGSKGADGQWREIHAGNVTD